MDEVWHDVGTGLAGAGFVGVLTFIRIIGATLAVCRTNFGGLSNVSTGFGATSKDDDDFSGDFNVIRVPVSDC
jgi:hypothetical protein